MTKLFMVCVLGTGVLFNSGCLVSRILAKGERQEWNANNTEREEHGLRPLTWEEYHNHGFRMP